jgi:hypothetical protein
MPEGLRNLTFCCSPKSYKKAAAAEKKLKINLHNLQRKELTRLRIL